MTIPLLFHHRQNLHGHPNKRISLMPFLVPESYLTAVWPTMLLTLMVMKGEIFLSVFIDKINSNFCHRQTTPPWVQAQANSKEPTTSEKSKRKPSRRIPSVIERMEESEPFLHDRRALSPTSTTSSTSDIFESTRNRHRKY